MATKKATKKIVNKKKKVKDKVKPVVATEKKVTQQKTKKVYEISRFFHGLIIFIVFLLYVELAIFGALYYLGYEVYLERRDTVLTRQVRAREKTRLAAIRHPKFHRARRNRVKTEEHSKKRTRFPVEAETKVETTKNNIEKKDKPVLKCPDAAVRKVSFVEEEYAPFAGEGDAVIEGNICFSLTDGSEKCFENVDVFINPVTSYSDEWYNRAWVGRELLQGPDKRALAFNRVVKSGKDGAFKFSGLKPGSYYVGTVVCLPENKDSKICKTSRFASKVTMKKNVKTTLKKVYP